MDPIAKKVYVAVQTEVQVIDETRNTVVNSFDLPTNSTITDVKPNPATGLIYVAAEGGGLFVVDPKTLTTVGFVNVNAATLAVNPATNTVYASDFNSTLYVIDGKSNTIDKMITVEAIENVAVNLATNRVYAAQDLFPGKVEVIDGKTNTEIADVSGGGDLSFDVAVNPANNTFYSSDQFGTVSVFDGKTNTLKATVHVGGQPTGISVDPVTGNIFDMDIQNNVVNVINGSTNTVTSTVAVGTNPEYADIDFGRGLLYVGDSGSAEMSVIKTR